jgi:S-adenosylmethionine uptake transporter
VTAGGSNLTGGTWLVADMALNIASLALVKAIGLDYPATQVVFLRASVGLAMMLPWALARREAFHGLDDLHLHAFRVLLSTMALTAGFFAVARIPFALFTAMNFTRPFVLMAMAVLFLGERVAPRRWLAAGVGFAGVLVAVNPAVIEWNGGVPALLLAIVAGTGAIIVTRRLAAAPNVVLMTFYTGGLSVLALPFAVAGWVPVAEGGWPVLLGVGLLAQTGQFCFLNAHRSAEAGFLAVLGYLSLVLSTAVGYLVFDEVPPLAFWTGAALIVGATAAASASPGRAGFSRPRGQPPSS